MEIIAHRGASYDAPENTLAALKLAWEQQADAAEVDVHLSKDGEIVVAHDYDLRKTAGLRRKLAALRYDELRKFDVGAWKHKRWRGERMPLLSEVIATVPSGKRLFIEVKCGPEFVAAFERIRKDWATREKDLIVIGFSLDCMREVKRTFPKVEVCWIVEFRRSLRTGRWRPGKKEALATALDAGLDGLDLGAKGPITADWIAEGKRAGLKFYVWTVDDPKLARKLAEAGIDGVTTNRPGWLRAQL